MATKYKLKNDGLKLMVNGIGLIDKPIDQKTFDEVIKINPVHSEYFEVVNDEDEAED